MKPRTDHIEARLDVYRLVRDMGFPLYALKGFLCTDAMEWQHACQQMTYAQLKVAVNELVTPQPWDFESFICEATAGREARDDADENEQRRAA